jgi:hypothetical protein
MPRSVRKGPVLAIILASYTMIVLDISIVITALPEIHRTLGFSATALSWVQNAYLLAFGGLLLLGARAGDLERRPHTGDRHGRAAAAQRGVRRNKSGRLPDWSRALLRARWLSSEQAGVRVGVHVVADAMPSFINFDDGHLLAHVRVLPDEVVQAPMSGFDGLEGRNNIGVFNVEHHERHPVRS